MQPGNCGRSVDQRATGLRDDLMRTPTPRHRTACTHATDVQVRQLAATAQPYSIAMLWWGPQRHHDAADAIEQEHQRRMVSLRADGIIAVLCPAVSDSLTTSTASSHDAATPFPPTANHSPRSDSSSTDRRPRLLTPPSDRVDRGGRLRPGSAVDSRAQQHCRPSDRSTRTACRCRNGRSGRAAHDRSSGRTPTARAR